MKTNYNLSVSRYKTPQKHITVTNLENDTEVTIRIPGRRAFTRRFSNITKAMEFVLLRGDRNTSLVLNGYRCVLHGWVS